MSARAAKQAMEAVQKFHAEMAKIVADDKSPRVNPHAVVNIIPGAMQASDVRLILGFTQGDANVSYSGEREANCSEVLNPTTIKYFFLAHQRPAFATHATRARGFR